MSDPVEDLNHIYSSTYVRSRKNNHIMYLVGFRYGETNNNILVNLYDYTDKVDLGRTPFSMDDYDWGFPALGNINENTCAVHLSRVPLRQFKRTIAASNIRRDVIGSSTFEAIGKRAPVTRLNNAEIATSIITAFEPTFFPFKEAIELVTKGQRISAAFSRTLSVGVDPHVDIPVVYYRTILIGTTDGDVINLARPAAHLKEQIQLVLPEVTFNVK